MNHTPRPYRGRFAPSPTGDLHFGSLVAALASYLEARRHGGCWLVRIENIDPPREVVGSASRILKDLARFGMRSDEEVLYQGTRSASYEDAVTQLLERGEAYWCGCSRADLPESGIYPGTCRKGVAKGRKPRSVRLRTIGSCVSFIDAIQGEICQDVEQEVGDFIIRRADRLPAYQLAVVVDDAFQGISHIVRGADLLESTPRQLLLQSKLGLPQPKYAHVPLVENGDGSKLSKRLQSDPVARQSPVLALEKALRFLGQNPPQQLTLSELWEWAQAHWDITRVPRKASHPVRG